jgi:pantoate kinase
VLELGATAVAAWNPGPSRRTVTSDIPGPLPITDDVVDRLAAERGGRLTVRLTHQLPVGQGFGMSAAGALATALAVASVCGVPRSKAIEVAHLAELFGGGGLGGVAAILGGGLEIRTRAGVPPFGRVLHRPFDRALIVGVLGRPIPSPEILHRPQLMDRISTVGTELLADPAVRSPVGFLEASEIFSDRVAIAPPAVVRVLRAVRARGAWAAQAMFGRSVFVVPRHRAARAKVFALLESHHVRAAELATSRRGASVRTAHV